MANSSDTIRVSVIIGIYNCAPTLVEALDSLYSQTYQNFKVILCEDGSSDNTYEVAEQYASKHPVRPQPQLRPSAPRTIVT